MRHEPFHTQLRNVSTLMRIGKRKGRDKEGKRKGKRVLPFPYTPPTSRRYAEGAGMLTKDEAQRISRATSIYRADWSTAQILAVLADERIRLDRNYRDTAIAMTALAIDAATRQPTRILEHGPWWEAARPLHVNTSSLLPVLDFDAVCADCFKPREHLHHGNTGTVHDHDFHAPADYHRDVNDTRMVRGLAETKEDE